MAKIKNQTKNKKSDKISFAEISDKKNLAEKI